MPLRVLRPAARRAQVRDHRRVYDYIETEYLHKFIMDCLGQKYLPVEIETNDALIHYAVRQTLTHIQFFAQRNQFCSIAKANVKILF
jgi:hypothetical protein